MMREIMIQMALKRHETKTFEDYAEDGRGVLAYHARAVLEKFFGQK